MKRIPDKLEEVFRMIIQTEKKTANRLKRIAKRFWRYDKARLLNALRGQAGNRIAKRNHLSFTRRNMKKFLIFFNCRCF